LTNGHANSEVLHVASVRRLEHAPTTLTAAGKTGLLTAYWRIVLTNNGEKRVTLTRYDVRQIVTQNNHDGLVYDSQFDQGIFLCSDGFKAIDLVGTPLKLEPGEAATFCAKVGVSMDPKAYILARKQFPGEEIQDIALLEKYLWSNGSDVFGNMVDPLPKGSYRFPALGTELGQVFLITFRSSKNSVFVATLNWYPFGLLSSGTAG
jgi:hypothetical protein